MYYLGGTAVQCFETVPFILFFFSQSLVNTSMHQFWEISNYWIITNTLMLKKTMNITLNFDSDLRTFSDLGNPWRILFLEWKKEIYVPSKISTISNKFGLFQIHSILSTKKSLRRSNFGQNFWSILCTNISKLNYIKQLPYSS